MWFAIEITACAGLALSYLFLLFISVRYRIERGQAQRLLETILLLTALWTLGLGLVPLLVLGSWWQFVWFRIAQIGLVVLALLTAEFANAFVQRPAQHWLRAGLVAVLLVLAIGIDGLPAELSEALLPWLPSWLGTTDLITWLLVAAWLSVTISAWWTSVTALRRTTSSQHRNRIRYLLVALLLFVVGDVLILLDGLASVYAGLDVRLLGFGLVTFAMVRHNLPDIKRSVLAGVRLVILAGLTAGVYLFAVFLGGWLIGALPDLSRWLVVVPVLFGALLLAAVVDVSLGPRLSRLFDRLFLGRDYDVQTALRAYSQRINLILDLERLADTTLEWLGSTLQVERSAFILFTPRGDGWVELRVLRATFTPLPSSKVFSGDGRLVAHFRNIRRPLSQYDVDMLSWFQAMPADERQWLTELFLDLYVPILVADQPVALLALGSRARGQTYSEGDLATLMILAGQTGIALENARLLDDLRAVQDDLHLLGTELAETNRQLQRLDQVKTDFIAIASHELRTPLTQIYGYSDVLSSLTGDELNDAQAVNAFVGGISRGAMRLKRVIDAMIDVLLIETGELALHLVPIPVSIVVQNAVETLQPAASQRGVSLSVRDLSDLPYVQADAVRLGQVFVSLLSNAIKFSPDGCEIVVSGRLDASATDGAHVEVLVVDQGIGIDPEHKDLVFEKFYRAESTLLHSTDDVNFKGAGPGLGLSIAKGIVVAHGGQLWVDSSGRDEESCPGSTFHIRLPVAGPPREAQHG
jgi:signal transduction histidine kinase